MLKSYNPTEFLVVSAQLRLQRVILLVGYMLVGLILGAMLGFTSLLFSPTSNEMRFAICFGVLTVSAIIGGIRTMWLNVAAHAVLCQAAIEANTRQISIALQRLELAQTPAPPQS